MNAVLQTQAQAPAKSSFTPVQTGLLQRKCSCGGSAGLTSECEDCDKKKLSLQRSTENSELSTRNSEHETRNSEGVPPIVHEMLRSPGQPLDAETRAFMEPRFGHDFSRVRVHTDETASASARAVNALAYTVGSHIAVRGDKHSPGTESGQRLLAHELAHVVQQASGNSGGDAESDAETTAQRIVGGQQVDSAIVGAAPFGLYRQHEESEDMEDETARLDWDELIRRLRDSRGMSPGAALGGDNEKKGIIPPIPETSPLLSQSGIPSWVKPGIDLNLPSEKAEREPGVGVSKGDWRLYVGSSKKGDPKIPGDSLEDFETAKSDLTPKERVVDLISGGAITLRKKLGGKQQKNKEWQKKKIEEAEKSGW